jgi:iron complex outermembrane receptor protein
VAEGSGMDGMLFTYANFGEAQVLGFDLGVNYYLNRYISLGTSLSYIKLLDFTAGTGQTELLLNVPEVKVKGSITLRDLGFENYYVRLSGRFHGAYEFASGHWTSEKYYDDGQMPARLVADLSLGYRFDQGFTVSANVKNLFNNKDVDILGAPISGTFAYLQVAYNYDGLEY